MKKFLVLLLTLMLSVCCAFAVACGDTGSSGTGNGGNNDNTGSGGGNNQPDPLVTESEFNSAMDVTDAPFQVVIVETETDAAGVDDQFTMTVNYNSGKIYWTESYEGMTEEGYYSNEGGTYYKYEKESGVWQKSESDLYLSCLEYCSPHTVIADELHIDLSYADFTYNHTLKAYVYTASMDGFTMALTITFENAKVTGFKVVMSEGGSLEAEMVQYTYTYNDTAVTLPSVSGNAPVNPNPGGDDDQGGEIVGGDSDCQHVWLQVSLNEGIMTYDCEKCGADKTENKTALYKNVSASIADSIYALADGKDQGASKFGASISKEEYVWEDADWSVHGINVKGVVMFVKMLSEMMSNVDFNVTSAPVKFTFSYSSSVVTEHGNAILMYTFDEENGKVTMYWLVESTVGGSTTEMFIYIDVDYDFNSNSLVGFAIEESVANEYVNMVFGYKYNANEFKYTEDENFVNQIQATASVLQAELDNVIDLKADFSKEYSDMMDEMNGGGNNPNPDNPNPDNPNPENPGESGTDKPNPDQPGTGDQGNTITQTQFVEALNIYDKSFIAIVRSRENLDGQTYENETIITYTPSAIMVEEYVYGQTTIKYFEIENDNVYYYSQDNGVWYKDCDQEFTKDVLDSYLYNYTPLIVSEMGLSFQNFTFESGKYFYEGIVSYVVNLSLSLSFDEKSNMTALSYDMYVEMDGMSMTENTVASFEYATYTVELPKEYVVVGDSTNPDPNPDEPDDGISAEWKALFNLENVTVNLDSVLDAYWLINGDTWFAHIDQNAVDNVVQNFVEVWYNGNESYRINGVYLDDEYVLMGEYTEYDNISPYLDIYLLYELNDFANSESYFKLSVGSDGSECYAASEVYVYGYLAYTNVQIKVVKGRLESITYTIPNGHEIEGEKYDLTNTLMFTNYGETVGHFPVFDTPVDPEEPKPEDPDKQESFVFYVRKVSASGYEWTVGGPAPGGGTMTNTFSVLTLNADKTLTLTQQGDVIDGSWEVLGDEIFITITDGTDYETYLLKYNQETNTISYNVNGATFEYDMPENVTYEDLLGEYVDCQTFYVDKVVSGDNTFKVGDTLLNGNVLTADFVVLKVFENGLFKLTTPQTTIRGEYEIDGENGIVNAYYLEDDEPSVIEIAMSNHGATLCFDMYGITYYLNVDGYEGGEGPETPSISSVFYVQSVIFEGETYYVGDQFLGETLSPEWATFNYFESDNTFILSYNGNVIEGSWENVDETLTQLYYTNANGEVCVIDVTLIQETKSLSMTIDGYTILFDFTYSEGGDEEYVTTTVTEEEFNNAIDFSRVAFQAKTWMETMYPDGDVRQEDLSVFFKDGSCLACQPIEGGVVWMYYALIDGEYHFYNSFDLVTWEEVPDYPAEMGYQQSVAFITPYGMIDMLNLTYADFTYDEECCYYVYQGEGVVTRLGFVNGQIEYVENIITQNGITKTIQSFVMHDNENIKFPTYDELVNGSEETLPEDELPSTLRVGISPDYEPFAFYDMDGQLVGFDIDLIKAVASVLGYSEDQIEFVVVDEFSSLLPGLGRGEYDIAMSGVALTPDRAELFIYTEPYVSYFASYEDENGEIIEGWEDYVVFGYYNSSILYAIEDAINILTKEGVMDQLVEFWLGEGGKLPSETVEIPEDDYVSGLEENSDGDYNFSMN